MPINWSDPNCIVTSHFSVKECIWLPRWERLATEADGLNDDVKIEILKTCNRLEIIRILLQHPLNIHSFFRSCKYNIEIGALEHDVHSKGMAADFDAFPDLSIEFVKDRLRPNLKRYDIRMEKHTPTWVHIDTRAPGVSGREFIAC